MEPIEQTEFERLIEAVRNLNEKMLALQAAYERMNNRLNEAAEIARRADKNSAMNQRIG